VGLAGIVSSDVAWGSAVGSETGLGGGAGAGLDAYTTEPLPTESKLWELPNVIISPHVAGRLTNYNEVTNKVFCENLRRYLNGKKLLNLVDKKKGF